MSIDSLPAVEGLPHHRRLLERALEHFRPDPRVAGLTLGGSLATGEADFYSDIDLYIIVDDPHFDALFAERDACAEKIGQPLFRFIPDHLPFGRHWYIVQYREMVKFDFLYTPASDVAPGPGWARALILKDSTGALTEAKSRSQAPPPEPDPNFLLALNQKFWTWCWYILGKIVRGELWEALEGVNYVRAHALLPMLSWANGWQPEGYRRLEGKLAPHTAAQLAATAPGLAPAALMTALEAEIALYRDLRTALFPRYDLAFDPEAEQAVEHATRQHWTAHAGR